MELPSSDSNKQLIANLQQQARKILDPIIPEGAEVVLLDYPHHSNVGDSLIWLGEITYLKSRNVSIKYVCQLDNYDAAALKKSCSEKTIILMHGGGNFGTLWPHLHAFRLQVMQDFPENKIVQLPQTIYFEQDSSLLETVNAIEQHGQVTLLVRSQACLGFAQQHFNSDCLLCPDMAFFIGPVDTKKEPVVDRFILARTDSEKSQQANPSKIEVQSWLSTEQQDWLEESFAEKMMIRVEKYTQLFRKYFDKNNLILLLIWNKLAQYRLERGTLMLSRGHVVITDRLHAHILCLLLNKQHVLMDNSYGKLSHFYHTWTSGFSNVTVGASHVKKPLSGMQSIDSQAPAVPLGVM
jgi:exopolysaccharide biosynthesis predicted pyruvyltransferase EpsI